ncbi:Histidine kinase osmosensor protein [Trifolium medium]|uniref:Histidine kinase osmosensor protein n=1 Tax=Trifolium medium TaxID=97028 RepID=A0A392NGE6_9FABA|nr:Histidine kinase osmosensor protein [Trifolium medium]
MQVLLALQGNMGRLITSKWLTKKGVCTMEASEWNGLTQILRELFHARSSIHNNNNFDAHYPTNLEGFKSKLISIKDMRNPIFIIVVDIGLLDLSTDIWKEQLNLLHKYFGRAKFVWILNHDTSNTIKTELRRKGHLLMVNKPLYKGKMIHILEAVIKERNLELQKKNMKEGDSHEFLEIDSTQFNAATSSDDSDISEISEKPIVKITNENEHFEENNITNEESCSSEDNKAKSLSTKDTTFAIEAHDRVTRSRKEVNDKKSLEGLRILLAEDTPVIQRVATIMLEKMGAVVVAVGDGQQAVEALNYMVSAEDCRRESLQKERNTRSQTEILVCRPYDLILMDCQV